LAVLQVAAKSPRPSFVTQELLVRAGSGKAERAGKTLNAGNSQAVPWRFAKLRPVSPEALAWAGLWATALDLAVAAALLGMIVNAWAPPQDLPWKPLRLGDPLGMATAYKFRRAAATDAVSGGAG
jgi:hypothetical protein